jgi:hypothetical protein
MSQHHETRELSDEESDKIGAAVVRLCIEHISDTSFHM